MTATRKKRKPAKKQVKIDFASIGRFVGLLTFIGILMVAGLWVKERVADPELLPIREVVLDGDFRRLDQSRVRSAVAAAIDGGFLQVDVNKVQAAIKALPWVKGASVRRIWPGTLVIRVSEHTPYARWGKDGLISSEGAIFRPASVEGFESLPLMEAGDEYKDEVLEQVEIVNRLLGVVGPVTQVERNAMGGWTLWVASGLRIELGVSDVTERLARVRFFIRRFEDELTTVELLDARYANGVAVRLKPAKEGENENSKGGPLS